MTTPHIEIIELTTQVVEIIELATGPQGDKGDKGDVGDGSFTPDVNAALAGASNPSATNVFITSGASLAQIIAFS